VMHGLVAQLHQERGSWSRSEPVGLAGRAKAFPEAGPPGQKDPDGGGAAADAPAQKGPSGGGGAADPRGLLGDGGAAQQPEGGAAPEEEKLTWAHIWGTDLEKGEWRPRGRGRVPQGGRGVVLGPFPARLCHGPLAAASGRGVAARAAGSTRARTAAGSPHPTGGASLALLLRSPPQRGRAPSNQPPELLNFQKLKHAYDMYKYQGLTRVC
jgi:hypothetical protein